MIVFRDMTYCAADCATYICKHNKASEAKDRERMKALAFLPSDWEDFSENCDHYQPINPEAA